MYENKELKEKEFATFFKLNIYYLQKKMTAYSHCGYIFVEKVLA